MVPNPSASATADGPLRPGSPPGPPNGQQIASSSMHPHERRRGLSRDPMLAAVGMQLGGDALAPVRTRLMRPGDVLSPAREPVRHVFAVLSGKVGVYDEVPQSDGKRSRSRLLEVLNAGQRAREVDLLGDPGSPPVSSVVALTPGLLAVVDAALFRDWCLRPSIAVIVLRELARESRAMESRRERWAELDVAGRLAALLLELHGDDRHRDDLWTPVLRSSVSAGVLVPHGLSQTDLGDLIGARRETVNRATRQLESVGLIIAGPRGTTLRDLPGLARRAGVKAEPTQPGARAVS